jgi:hypothetical protein
VPIDESLPPVLSRDLDSTGPELSLFSVISVFCTPRDIVTDELRGEALVPAHAKTVKFLRASAVA